VVETGLLDLLWVSGEMIESLDLARVLATLLFLGQSNDQDRFHPARKHISGALKVEI
jgi:hypothetical protein